MCHENDKLKFHSIGMSTFKKYFLHKFTQLVQYLHLCKNDLVLRQQCLTTTAQAINVHERLEHNETRP